MNVLFRALRVSTFVFPFVLYGNHCASLLQRRLDRFQIHDHRGPSSNPSHRFSSYLIITESFAALFLVTMRLFYAFFNEMYSLFGSNRLFSLICSYSRSFPQSSLIFPPFLGLSGVSVHFYYDFVFFSVITVTFRDFDLDIPSVCVHIFPRRTLAYQVSIFLACQYLGERYQRSRIGILFQFLITVYFFSLFYDIIF